MAAAYQLSKLAGNPNLEVSGMIRMAGSQEAYFLLLDAFLTIIPPLIKKLKIDEDVTDFEALRAVVAAIEKMSMSVGAVEMGMVAAQLDAACVENNRAGVQIYTELLLEQINTVLLIIRAAAMNRGESIHLTTREAGEVKCEEEPQPEAKPPQFYVPPPDATQRSAYRKSVSDKRRVLAVDDMPDTLNTMKLLFRKAYYFTGITDPLEALKFLMNNDIDVIVMDIEMPTLDGCSLASLIRKNRFLADIPIIFLTGNANANNVWAAHNSGAADFVKKPFNSIILMKRIEKQFGVDDVE